MSRASDRAKWARGDAYWSRISEQFYRDHPEIVITGRRVWDIFLKHARALGDQQAIDSHLYPTPDINFAFKWIQLHEEAKEELTRVNEARKQKP